MTILTFDTPIENMSDSFDPIPDGQYIGTIDKVELTRSKTKDEPMLKVTWVIADGEYEGRKLFDNVVVTVEFKVKQYANVAGIESGTRMDTDDLEGTNALLTVGSREYEGRVMNQINKIEPAS